ncbi:hypothetical protein HOG16_02675 [Candidatus Woesearchaeota archaeon]|jgi:hypothetical protein|nr:hypothetical protein [Candidatus Woesearchaeota archaeon]MBT4322002.1 hypothetical protein [Candidatus Woesearchaeota archaeon]MBT4630748.1 hypothetical protein [Candidatus Woesearchaeota archaeon]
MDNLKKLGLVGAFIGATALAGCSSHNKSLENSCDIHQRLEIKEIEMSYLTKKRLSTYREYHSGALSGVDYVAIAFDLVWRDTGRLKVDGNCVVASLENTSVDIVEEGDSYYICVALDNLGIDYEVRLEKDLEFGYIEQK